MAASFKTHMYWSFLLLALLSSSGNLVASDTESDQKQALEQNEKAAEKLFIDGNGYFVKKDYQRAEQKYRKALEMTSSELHPELLHNLSWTLFKLGKDEEAKKYLRDYITIMYPRLVTRPWYMRLVAPEYISWANWIAKYLLLIEGVALFFMMLDEISGNDPLRTLMMFLGSVGLFGLWYAI